MIGFSAAGGRREVRQQIIEDRRRYLPVLRSIPDHGCGWRVGNCAEAETFAHLKGMEEGKLEAIAVILTLDLKNLTSHGPCQQCVQLVNDREFRSISLSLAPVRSNNLVDSASQASHQPGWNYGTFDVW